MVAIRCCLVMMTLAGVSGLTPPVVAKVGKGEKVQKVNVGVMTSAALTPLFWMAGSANAFEPSGPSNVDIGVFAIGLAPFLVAAFEFWRRIAFKESFGTRDPVVIDADADQLRRFGGRRVLGNDALVAAYVLMAIAGGSVLLSLAAVLPDVIR